MEVVCDCGCGKSGHANRMVTVTTEHRQLSKTELRTRTGKRWQVLPACEAPFKRELNAAALMKELVDRSERQPWWRRLLVAHLVYNANYMFRRRKSTRWATAKQSFQMAAVFGAPPWLSDWLSKKWKPKPQPASPAAIPTVVREPAGGSF